jgi:DNA-binding transcriptional LysR family regulator
MSSSPAFAVDWEQQRAFLAVLETGSLSAAARDLKLAQPTVRRRIEDLEAQVGAALFTRSPAGLTPTATARQLGDHARTMAAAAKAFTRAASAEAGSAAGTVRITASEVVSIELLPDILAPLQRAHPGLVLELWVSNRNEDLLRREADVAVRMSPPLQSALLARRIGPVPVGLHARSDFLEAHGRPTTLEDVRRLPFIGFERETPVVELLRARGLEVRREDFSFRSDSDLAQLAAIRAGLGVGACQVGVAARDSRLERVLADSFQFDLETWVVMHEDLKGVRRVRLVFDALVEGMAAYVRGKPLARPG